MTFRKGNSRAAKLSPADVQEMREAYLGGATQSSLSRRFGVSVGQVGRIVRREAWQSFVGDEPSEVDIQVSVDKFRRALGEALNVDVELEKLKEPQ